MFTGPGKGKTSSALGIVLRCLGRGKTVLLARFTKAVASGEMAILAALPGITVLDGDYGMTPPPHHPDYSLHVAAARAIFAQARAAAPDHDCIVLDEICGVTARNMIAEEEVTTWLDTLRPDQIAVLTGRGAGVRLIAAADTVSEIESLKHGYQRGIGAQEGVEL